MAGFGKYVKSATLHTCNHKSQSSNDDDWRYRRSLTSRPLQRYADVSDADGSDWTFRTQTFRTQTVRTQKFRTIGICQFITLRNIDITSVFVYLLLFVYLILAPALLFLYIFRQHILQLSDARRARCSHIRIHIFKIWNTFKYAEVS